MSLFMSHHTCLAVYSLCSVCTGAMTYTELFVSSQTPPWYCSFSKQHAATETKNLQNMAKWAAILFFSEKTSPFDVFLARFLDHQHSHLPIQ